MFNVRYNISVKFSQSFLTGQTKTRGSLGRAKLFYIIYIHVVYYNVVKIKESDLDVIKYFLDHTVRYRVDTTRKVIFSPLVICQLPHNTIV